MKTPEHAILPTWNSIYQTPEYNEAIAQTGARIDVLTTQGGHKVYFNGTETLTAWEVDASVDMDTLDLPSDYAAMKLSEAGPYEAIAWAEDNIDDYYTSALFKHYPDAYFSQRFMRNVLKAQKAGVTLEVVETSSQIEKALDKFTPHEGRRDGLTVDAFRSTVKHLLDASVARAFVTTTPGSTELSGSSVVLLNDTQANMRYYTADRGLPYGHYLHHATIEHLFKETGLEIVDQSGISPPHETDPTFRGVTEFKRQVGGTVLRFTNV